MFVTQQYDFNLGSSHAVRSVWPVSRVIHVAIPYANVKYRFVCASMFCRGQAVPNVLYTDHWITATSGKWQTRWHRHIFDSFARTYGELNTHSRSKIYSWAHTCGYIKMRSNEIDSTVRLANISLIHFPHNGLWPFYVDGSHRLLQANSRDALEQMTVNGIPHHINYGVNFYSVYILSNQQMDGRISIWIVMIVGLD